MRVETWVSSKREEGATAFAGRRTSCAQLQSTYRGEPHRNPPAGRALEAAAAQGVHSLRAHTRAFGCADRHRREGAASPWTTRFDGKPGSRPGDRVRLTALAVAQNLPTSSPARSSASAGAS